MVSEFLYVDCVDIGFMWIWNMDMDIYGWKKIYIWMDFLMIPRPLAYMHS